MFAKGHGTQNDFVLLPDLDGRLTLTARRGGRAVRPPPGARCRRRAAGDHRRRGRATRACSTGCPKAWRRRLVHGLPQRRRLDRADVRQRRSGVRALPAGQRAGEPRRVRRRFVGRPAAGGAAQLGRNHTPTSPSRWARPTSSAPARPSSAAGRFAGLAIDVGNPHLACVDPELTADELAALDVAAPVQFDRAQFPDGVNVEVLTAPVGRRGVDAGTRARVLARPAHAEREPSRPRSPRWHTRARRPARCGCAYPAARSPSASPTPAATCAARRSWWPAARSPTTGGARRQR